MDQSKGPGPVIGGPILVIALAKEFVNPNVPLPIAANFGFNAATPFELNIYRKTYLPGKYVTVVTVLSGEKVPVESWDYNDNKRLNEKTKLLDTGEEVRFIFEVR
jgi:hypothetical protein